MAAKGTRPSSGRPSCRLSCNARQTMRIAATRGTASTGSALNLDAIARPPAAPVSSAIHSLRRSTKLTPPSTASTVKVVLAGSMAKKWLSWIACALKA